MKSYKYFLLGTVVAATILPFSLTAIDDTKDDGRSHYASRAHVKVAPVVEEQGWFSSFRSTVSQKAEAVKAAVSQKVEEIRPQVAKTFKTVGRELQKESTGSAHGQLKQVAAKGFVSWCLPTVLQNFAEDITTGARQIVGAGFIKISQDVFGGKKTGTDLKLEELKNLKGEAKFRKAAQDLSFEAYEKVVTRLAETGQVSKKQMQEINASGIYLDELATQLYRPGMTVESFSAAAKTQGMNALQNLKAVEAAPYGQKMNLINQHVKNMFEKAQLVHDIDSNRIPVTVIGG